MHESQKHGSNYWEWTEKPVPKEYVHNIGSHFYEFPEQMELIYGEKNQNSLGL